MTEPVVLRPTAWQRLRWLGLGVLFLAAVAWAASGPERWDAWRVAGLGLLGVCGLLAIATAAWARLELSPEGLREWRLGASTTRWSDIEDLRLERQYQGRMVITFRRRPGADDRPELIRRISPRGGVTVRYGLTPMQQLALMEQWRARWSGHRELT